MSTQLFRYENWGVGVFSANINMALEEFLIQRVAQERAEKHLATVRFYSFSHDSIVLGYGQDLDVIRQLDSKVELTRRITGGSHIQTGPNMIAYSFVVPRDGTFNTYEELRAYYAGSVARALQKIGIGNPVVDNQASTINVNGRVIASHALWWGVKSALLHGLIMLSPYDVDAIASRVLLKKRIIDNKVYSEYLTLKNLPTVSTELRARRSAPSLKHRILYDVVSRAILDEVAGDTYTNQSINKSVINKSLEFLTQRYGVSQWTQKHTPTFTREEVEEIPGEELAGPLKKNLGYCLFIQVRDEDFKQMSNPLE
ncbi:lipoate--protein ligase family protein [Patescibacteria group bacterium]|nr:lipoate--protein ligase family protein [Patescibacteria group bacterium]